MKNSNALFVSCMLILILAMGGYYVYVLDLNRHRDVSDSYQYYYLDKKVRFWNKYQSMYIIPGHVYDTTVERPFFLDRTGFSAPDSNGRGMAFTDRSAFIFKLYKNPDTVYAFLRLKSELGHTMITVGDHSTAYLDEPGSYEIYIPIERDFISEIPGEINYVPVSTSLPVNIYALAITSRTSVPGDSEVFSLNYVAEDELEEAVY